MITKNEIQQPNSSTEQEKRSVQSVQQKTPQTIDDEKFKLVVSKLGDKYGTKMVNNFVKLFAVLGGIYGSKWSSHLNNDDAYFIVLDQWLKGLKGLSEEEIKLGVEKCRNSSDFVITLPRFKFFAKGLYDTSAALELAMKKDFRHFSIEMAYIQCGRDWFFKTKSEKDMYSKFTRVYALICDDIMTGKTKPDYNNNPKLQQKVVPEHVKWLIFLKARYPFHYNAYIGLNPKDKELIAEYGY